MVLHLPFVSEHGRQVLVAVGQGSCLLTLLSTVLLRLSPPPPPTAAVLEYVLPRAAYPAVVMARGLLEEWRPGLHLLAATSDISAVVVAAALLVVGASITGRGAHPRLMGAAHWAMRAQILNIIISVLLWAVVTSWAGHLSVGEATEQWKSLLSSYENDSSAHAAVDEIQSFLGCCGPDGAERFRSWVQLRNGTVPPSCCRPESEFPCLFEDIFAYEAAASSAAERQAVWRRVLPRVLHLRPCPALALPWVRSRAQHVLGVVMMTAAQHVALAGLALSALYNSALNRDPLAPAPAAALRGRFRHPLAMTQY